MSAGKVFGGLLALIGGVFVLIAVFLNTSAFSSGNEDLVIRWIINLIVSLFAIIGGILAIASKSSGGALALIAGIMAFLMFLIAYLVNSADLLFWFYPYSGFFELTGWGYFTLIGSGVVWVISFEGFLIFLGAIIILSSHDRY